MFRIVSGALALGMMGTLALADQATPCQPGQDCTPQYTADDVLKHVGAGDAGGVVDPNLGPSRGLVLGGNTAGNGATREVCLGTADQCTPAAAAAATGAAAAAASVPVVAPPPEFNLLITFNYDSFELTEQAKANLREFARALQDPALAASVWSIDGHTDAKGPSDYNDELSLNRARAVVAFLRDLGIDTKRLQAKGYGESKLYDAGDPEADINRRVEAALVAR